MPPESILPAILSTFNKDKTLAALGKMERPGFNPTVSPLLSSGV
jgi:hypothetical protein